jgi:hypothetical protein
MEHLPAVMWMNHNLPEGSRILCFRTRHRYLSDHELVVVERHPLTARLFLQNSAAAEIEQSAPLDTMEAAVISAERGRYFLETVFADSTIMRTHPFALRRDTSHIFLRPGLLESP